MGRKRVKRDSKCNTRCNGKVDRISQLPDDIIACILSFLPLKKAAATSVLSTRWYDLWRQTTNLILYTRDGVTNKIHERERSSKFIEWVNSILESHKAHSLKEFAIYSNLNKSAHCALTKWLEFAFSRRVEVLGLNFCKHNDKENAVVLEDFLSKSLFQSSNSNLKSLRLSDLNVSGEAIKLFLRNCPLLERLIISNVVFTSDIEVCGGATGLVLKHLIISYCSSGKSIKVSAPNLTRLIIDDHRSKNVIVENLPELVMLDFSCTKGFSANRFPHMPKLKKLTVKYFGHLLPAIPSLLWSSPCLQEFEFLYIRSKRIKHGMEGVNVGRVCHNHLKVFKFKRFDVEVDDHMELVSYILDNCIALQKLFIYTHFPVNWLSYSDMKLLEGKKQDDREMVKQLLQPKLSTHIQLFIS